MKLNLELIPKTAYGQNLRSHFSEEEWWEISRYVREHAALRCEICGKEVTDTSKLDAHESWEYKKIINKKGKIKNRQILIDIIAVCHKCHKTIHIGRAKHGKHYRRYVKHFMKINGCTKREFKKQEREAYKKWWKNSSCKWKLKITKNEVWELLENKYNSEMR